MACGGMGGCGGGKSSGHKTSSKPSSKSPSTWGGMKLSGGSRGARSSGYSAGPSRNFGAPRVRMSGRK